MSVIDKPRLGEWVQLVSLVAGALGLVITGIAQFTGSQHRNDDRYEEVNRRLSKLEDEFAKNGDQRNETNERLARIEERLNVVLPKRN